MKIALFTRYPQSPDRPKGGVESVAVVLVRALAENGDLDVHVVTLERDLNETAIEHHDGATIHRLPGSGWPQMADIVAGPGRRRLIDYVVAMRPALLHSHETHGLMLDSLPFPHLFTVHGFDSENLTADSARFASIRTSLWGILERRGLARQRHIISISPYVRRMIEPHTSARIHEIENPVDARFFGIVPVEAEPRVLCVGWLNERKNTVGSIEAFAAAVKCGALGKLVIAGQSKDPAYLDLVSHSIARNNLSHRVELLGHIDQERLMEELSKAAAFLLPSRQENSPMAIAEAMAAGVPVITSNRCGMPYMVSEGETGFLVNPNDIDQIAGRITELLEDPSTARRMGQAARRQAETRFSPIAVARQTLQAYRSALTFGG